MFTKEQLAKWEADGFTFPPEYSQWAVEAPPPEKPQDDNLASTETREDIEKFFDVAINEDSEERCIRKLLHKIKNYPKKKRMLDLLWSTYIYFARNFNLNGETLGIIVVQLKENRITGVDVSSYRTVESYNQISDRSLVGIAFGSKFSIYTDSQKSLKIITDYIQNQTIKDDFKPAFSYLNWKIIELEINRRKYAPQLVDQSFTSLCGMVCIVNLMIEKNFSTYRTFIEDLYYYSDAFYGNKQYYIRPRNVLRQIYDVNPKSGDYPSKMPFADYIALCSIKCSENKVIPYYGDNADIEGLGGMSLPNELYGLLSNFLNCTDVEDYTTLTGANFDEEEILKTMNKAIDNGRKCLMLIDSFMLDKSPTLKEKIYSKIPYPNHWVIYNGKFSENDESYSFQVSTWGYSEFYDVNVKKSVFKDTYYGYLECKL